VDVPGLAASTTVTIVPSYQGLAIRSDCRAFVLLGQSIAVQNQIRGQGLFLLHVTSRATLERSWPRDGNVRHVGALWGGNSFNFQPTEANFTTYANFVARFAQIAKERGADVQLSNHSNFDETLEKMAKLKTRARGQPRPFVVGTEAEARIFTVQSECALANRAMLHSAAAK
jgi:hypothetical protein